MPTRFTPESATAHPPTMPFSRMVLPRAGASSEPSMTSLPLLTGARRHPAIAPSPITRIKDIPKPRSLFIVHFRLERSPFLNGDRIPVTDQAAFRISQFEPDRSLSRRLKRNLVGQPFATGRRRGIEAGELALLDIFQGEHKYPLEGTLTKHLHRDTVVVVWRQVPDQLLRSSVLPVHAQAGKPVEVMQAAHLDGGLAVGIEASR